MKTAVMSWIFLLLSLVAALAQKSADLERIHFLGREYVRVKDFARASNLQPRWLLPYKILQLTGRSHRIVLTADSREAEINGVKVWLSFPIAVRGTAAYVSANDYRTTLNPVLNPRKSARKIDNIVIDAGHGGKDPGNRSGVKLEKRYTLLLAQELRAQLRQAGFSCSLTRGTDVFVELPVRPEIAMRRQADVFVSLHFNGTSSRQVRGVETYCFTPAGASSTNARGEGTEHGSSAGNRSDDGNMILALSIQRSLVKALGAEDRGVRRARFAVLRDAQMPAVLVEGGFLSNATEARKIDDPAYRRQMAKAIADGILAYKRAVERE